MVEIQESVWSDGIWTLALGGGYRRHVADAGVDGNGVRSNSSLCEGPQCLLHRALMMPIITFADVGPTRAQDRPNGTFLS